MVVSGVSYLPAFIGAWITFKLAANWQRIKSESDEVRKGTLIALIGNVFSFALAIAIGFWLNPTVILYNPGSFARRSLLDPFGVGYDVFLIELCQRLQGKMAHELL